MVRENSGTYLGIRVVREIRFRQLNEITYLYFICAVIHFSYAIITEFGLLSVHLFDTLPAIS